MKIDIKKLYDERKAYKKGYEAGSKQMGKDILDVLLCVVRQENEMVLDEEMIKRLAELYGVDLEKGD